MISSLPTMETQALDALDARQSPQNRQSATADDPDSNPRVTRQSGERMPRGGTQKSQLGAGLYARQSSVKVDQQGDTRRGLQSFSDCVKVSEQVWRRAGLAGWAWGFDRGFTTSRVTGCMALSASG